MISCAHQSHNKKKQSRLQPKSQGQFLCQISFGAGFSGTISPGCVARSCSKTCQQHGSFLISARWTSPRPPSGTSNLAGRKWFDLGESRAFENLIDWGVKCRYLTLCVDAGFESGRQWQQVCCLLSLLMSYGSTFISDFCLRPLRQTEQFEVGSVIVEIRSICRKDWSYGRFIKR